jgi:hypothetical protein
MASEEDDQLRQLNDALGPVVDWETHVVGDEDGGWKATDGSELAIDDKAAHPFTVSPASWSAIIAAVSHLGALRDSLFHSTGSAKVHVRIHTHGQFSLIRGALENASLAYWLLEPDQSVERITRRIQEDWDEVKQVEAVKVLVGAPTSKTMAQREREYCDLLVRVGGDPLLLKKRPGYGDIVRTVGATQRSGEKAAFFLWKACSSIAHGEFRGQLAYLSTEQVGPAGRGLVLAQTTGNVQLMITGTLAACETTREAMKLYARRSGTPIRI